MTHSTEKLRSGSKSCPPYGCLNVEMESSALYTVCTRRRKRAAMISAVSGNPESPER
ncbi:MAG: hypothetical protein ACLSE4_09750 [Clostridium sp.]